MKREFTSRDPVCFVLPDGREITLIARAAKDGKIEWLIDAPDDVKVRQVSPAQLHLATKRARQRKD